MERAKFANHQSDLRADLEKNQKKYEDIMQFLVEWGDDHPENFVTVTMRQQCCKQAFKNYQLEDCLADFEHLLQKYEERLGVLEHLDDEMKNSS